MGVLNKSTAVAKKFPPPKKMTAKQRKVAALKNHKAIQNTPL